MSTVQALLLVYKLADMLGVEVDDTKDTLTNAELCRVLQAAIQEVSGEPPKRSKSLSVDEFTDALNVLKSELELVMDMKISQSQYQKSGHAHGWQTGPQYTWTGVSSSGSPTYTHTVRTDALSSITTA